MTYNRILKRGLSEQIGLTVRRSLVTGDFRQAVVDAEALGSSQFLSITYSREGKRVFSVPNEDAAGKSGFLQGVRYDRLHYPLYLDGAQRESIGDLEFTYRRLEFLPAVIIVWMALSMALLFFFRRSKQELIFLRQREMERVRAVSLATLATQVAHDIRSPLSALDSVMKDLPQFPEEKRVIVRSALGRIRDIANNLIEKNDAQDMREDSSVRPPSGRGTDPSSVQLLSSLIDTLITEKRIQYRSQIDIDIDSNLEPSSYGLFASVPVSEFKRVVSNLINNAVEALPGKGRVTVRLSADEGWIVLRVRDNGKGIPAEVLGRLGQRGETHGKPGGSGLGLYHAKTNIAGWGGVLEISSESGKGTTVTMRLPRAQAPAWFVSELVLGPGARVVVLDDDTSIHQVWRGRFDSARVHDQGVMILHFSTPQEVRAWVRKDGSVKSDGVVYLMDYELLGHRETGLSLADELGVGKQTILVTSRFEEPGILADSVRLGARLIPKPLAGFVPIVVRKAADIEVLDAALIDDDELIRLNWKMEAEKAGMKFRSFQSIDAFLAESDRIGRATPIYVDANLANGVDGATESERLLAIGFREIRLTTGHAPGRFSRFKHLRGVVGKDPPWAPADA